MTSEERDLLLACQGYVCGTTCRCTSCRLQLMDRLKDALDRTANDGHFSPGQLGGEMEPAAARAAGARARSPDIFNGSWPDLGRVSGNARNERGPDGPDAGESSERGDGAPFKASS